MWSYQSFDEGRTDSGRTSRGRNPAFIYIFSLASLLQCIGQNFCINYIQRVVFLYIILRFPFLSIIGCHNCSYSAILNSFLYLEIQLYDSFSLSLLHVH